MEGILGRGTRIVQPPLSITRPEKRPFSNKTHSVDAHDRRPIEQALVAEGVHRDIDMKRLDGSGTDDEDSAVAYAPVKKKSASFDKHEASSPTRKRDLHASPSEHRSIGGLLSKDHDGTKDHGKGHAHDPLEEHLFLAVGPGGSEDFPDPPVVSESPPAADVNIYETAYHYEVERIRESRGKEATLYLTRRVDNKKEYQEDENLVGISHGESTPKTGFARLLEMAREKGEKGKES